MTLKTKLIIGTVGVLSAFAVGRYTVPEKVRIETKTVEVEKKTDTTNTDQKKHQETVTVEVKKPDGTVETTTKTVVDTNTDRKTKDVESDTTTTDKLKEVTRGSSPVTILAVGGIHLQGIPTPFYGATVSKPILGPFTVSVGGYSDATITAGVGLTF